MTHIRRANRSPHVPNGDRIKRQNSTETRYYLYDREDVIAILDATGTPIQTFLHGPGTDEPVAMKIGTGIYNYVPVGTGIYYYIPDGLGSTVALINIVGNSVAAAYRYDVFGGVQNSTGSLAKQNSYLFTGREYDWQTGVYYYRARSYDANLGRFLQRDPAGMVDGTNMYVYCGNDPVNRKDPSGKMLFVLHLSWWGYLDVQTSLSVLFFSCLANAIGYPTSLKGIASAYSLFAPCFDEGVNTLSCIKAVLSGDLSGFGANLGRFAPVAIGACAVYALYQARVARPMYYFHFDWAPGSHTAGWYPIWE